MAWTGSEAIDRKPLSPEDDGRHWPTPGGRMRDSLFWQFTAPDDGIGFQAYLYLNQKGRAGFNVVVWGGSEAPIVLDLVQGEVGPEEDLQHLCFAGLSLEQCDPLQSARISYASEAIRLELVFEALHKAFSYHDNPDGVPTWFAHDRFEQTGRIRGWLEFGDRRIAVDRIGHRDHSWGVRDWSAPQHWKWFVAYTPTGDRLVNGWIWISRGEWGFAGYVVRDGVLAPISSIRQSADYDADMSQRRLRAEILDVHGGVMSLTMERFGLVRLPTDDSARTIIMEAACTAALDGREGAGQFETQWSQNYLDQLTRRKRESVVA